MQHRRVQKLQSYPCFEAQSVATTNQLLATEPLHALQSSTMSESKPTSIALINTAVGPSNAIDSNGALNRVKTMNQNNNIDQQSSLLSDTFNNSTADSDTLLVNGSPPSTSSLKNNLSAPDLDPFERRKQAILDKVEAKLEKAQQLYQVAQQRVEQSISEFLRATTMPAIGNESSSSKTVLTAYEKRIRTLQDAKNKLEKKIEKYQTDINRIQTGDISHHYRSSKDILNNIKNKVSNGAAKYRPGNVMSTPNFHEQTNSLNNQESDSSQMQINPSATSLDHNADATNNHFQYLSFSTSNNAFETKRSSPSNSIANENTNPQFYIDINNDLISDGNKSNRRSETIIQPDISTIHEPDRSSHSKRRQTEDTNNDFNDQTSDHSNDDRFLSNTISRRNTLTTIECYQVMTRMEAMQKLIDSYDGKMNAMLKQLDMLISMNESQNERSQRLTIELTDLTDLHQAEMKTIQTDLRKLEAKFFYQLDECCTGIFDRLEQLDTRTTKVEQTQAHAFETEENTHPLISKLVNILLNVFTIILFLLSTIKNLLQSRVHAILLLVLLFTWITIHYLPADYFQMLSFKSKILQIFFIDNFQRHILCAITILYVQLPVNPARKLALRS